MNTHDAHQLPPTTSSLQLRYGVTRSLRSFSLQKLQVCKSTLFISPCKGGLMLPAPVLKLPLSFIAETSFPTSNEQHFQRFSRNCYFGNYAYDRVLQNQTGTTLMQCMFAILPKFLCFLCPCLCSQFPKTPEGGSFMCPFINLFGCPNFAQNFKDIKYIG